MKVESVWDEIAYLLLLQVDVLKAKRRLHCPHFVHVW